MNLNQLVHSHVERCMMQALEIDTVKQDNEGDYPFRWKSAMCWVQVEKVPEPAVRILAHAVRGLKPSAKLHKELNDINVGMRVGRTFLTEGIVVVDYEMPWRAAEFEVLDRTSQDVANIASSIGPTLAAVFGGETPFEWHDMAQGEEQG